MEFFTSDLHLGHANSIQRDNRPFANVEQMNEVLIERWNARVDENDSVYLLGDLICMGDRAFAQEVLQRLKGRIFLIKGNHDAAYLRSKETAERFELIVDYLEIDTEFSGVLTKLVLSHYPIFIYRQRHLGAIMLHGHVHDCAEYRYLKRMQREYLNSSAGNPIHCALYDTYCGLYDWAPATLEQIVTRL